MKALGLVLVGVLAAACSSPSSGGATSKVDRSQFERPTGSFSPDQGGSVLDSYGNQRGASKYNVAGSPVGGGSTGTNSMGLRLMSGAGLSACNMGTEQGSCACAGGGTFSWTWTGMAEARQAAQNRQAFSLGFDGTFTDCATGAATMTGKEVADITVRDTSSEARAMQTLSMAVDVNLKVKAQNRTEDVAATMLIENGKIWLSIRVNDGNIVVAYDSGKLVIRDRNTSWTCDQNADTGRCRSSLGAEGEFQAGADKWRAAAGSPALNGTGAEDTALPQEPTNAEASEP